MDLALHCPERIEKLILIDSTGYTQKPFAVEWFLKNSTTMSCALALLNKRAVGWILRKAVFFDPSLVTDEEIEGWMKPYSVKGSVRATMELRKVDFAMEEIIKKISQPTLIIWGQKDMILPVTMAERFRADINDALLKILTDCRHNPQEENPEEVNSLIKAFLLE